MSIISVNQIKSISGTARNVDALQDSTQVNAIADSKVSTLVNQIGADTGAGLVGFKANGVGAVAGTVQAKLRESVSVKDFGAVGDGVTDDTAAIQAAINSLYGRMGVIFFPVGNYLVSTITVKSNIALRGVKSQGVASSGSRVMASGASTLLQAPSTDKVSGWYNFAINDMSFYGAGTLSGNGVDLDGCTNFQLENVYIENFLGASKIGLYINKPTNAAGYFSITNCFVLYSYHNVRIYNVNGGVVSGGRISNASSAGRNLDIQGTYSVTFNSVPVEGAAPSDSLLYAYGNNKLTFNSCYFEKGTVLEQNNNDVVFLNPHLNTSNTVYLQGGSTNNTRGRIVMDSTAFSGGNTQNLLHNGHLSYWDNTTLIGWTVSGVTVTKSANSEITNSSTAQITSSSTSSYLRQIIRNEKKFLRNGRFKLGVRSMGDIDGTTIHRINVRAHSPTLGFTSLIALDVVGASFATNTMDIDVSSYAVQAGTYNDIDYIAVDIYPNINANGVSKTCEIDWVVLSDGNTLSSPIPPNNEPHIYYANPDANPALASNSNISGKQYFNIFSGKMRIWTGSSFVLLN